MSGVFGILDTHAETDVSGFLAEAAKRLSHFAWYQANTHVAVSDAVGLGRIGIGIFNKETQPVVSADGRDIMVMSGELRDEDALRQRLESAGFAPRSLSHPELALCAFQAYGINFARELHGDFMIAVYDTARRQFVITNDRYGLYPHFYYCSNGRLVFAPEVKGVLAAPFVERKLNITAAVEYFRFQQVLGDKTFHEGISLFPYAAVGQFNLNTGAWTVSRYWDWDEIPDRSDITLAEAAREAGRLLRRSVERRTGEDGLRPGVFLSGGLDSRTVLALVPPRKPPPATVTFGVENCRDVYYARKIASKVGSPNYWFDLPDGRWIVDHADLHLTLTEGFHSWINMHGITMFPMVRELMDYNLTGWAGEFPLGYPPVSNYITTHPVDQSTLIVQLYDFFTQSHSWPGLTEAEERLLYTPVFAGHALGLAFESLKQELNPYLRFKDSHQMDYFVLMNHCRRLTQNMITMERSHIEVRFPYWDHEFLNFVYSLDAKVRIGKPRGALYLALVTQETPDMSRIPYDKDEFLPTTERWRYKIQSVSLKARRKLKLYPQRPTLYADYENYLRHELRQWAEAILFDRRTEQRGMLNLSFVRSLLARHISGREEWTIGKIAPLISFELMMRKYFD